MTRSFNKMANEAENIGKRMRPNRITSDSPKAIDAQNRYFRKQQEILEKKKKYRQEIKEGKRIVIPKSTKNKVLTEEQRHELRKQKKRKHYRENAEDILAYQAKQKKKKLQEKKIQEAKNAVDAFNKLNGW